MTPGCVHSISYIDFQSSEIVPLGVNYYLLTYLWHSILGLLGEVSSLSCDREFTDCRLQTCFVQSPNFPGVYPRNRRCLYHVSTRQPFIKVNHVRLIIYNQHPQKMLTRKVYVVVAFHWRRRVQRWRPKMRQLHHVPPPTYWRRNLPSRLYQVWSSPTVIFRSSPT